MQAADGSAGNQGGGVVVWMATLIRMRDDNLRSELRNNFSEPGDRTIKFINSFLVRAAYPKDRVGRNLHEGQRRQGFLPASVCVCFSRAAPAGAEASIPGSTVGQKSDGAGCAASQGSGCAETLVVRMGREYQESPACAYPFSGARAISAITRAPPSGDFFEGMRPRTGEKVQSIAESVGRAGIHVSHPGLDRPHGMTAPDVFVGLTSRCTDRGAVARATNRAALPGRAPAS